jgi:guanylate kinase
MIRDISNSGLRLFMLEPLGLLFVIVGPAGVGKNALMNTVLHRFTDLHQLPTATTRAIRPGEQQGREHMFVSVGEFQRMIAADELVEHQVVHENYYGVPRKTVEQAIAVEDDLIADIDVLGATALRSNYSDHTVLIFLQPPSIDELRHRMEKRGESPAEIEKRMRRVEMELAYAPECDYLITNDEMDKAGETLYGIVLAERSHRELLRLRKKSQLPEHLESRAMMNELG